jgi:translation initiation factor IF-3
MVTNNNQQPQQFRVRINQFIKTLQVRLINEDGTSEILNTRDALKMAQDQGLDLVEINGKASPSIVRIVDFGKFKYEQAKKAKADKKNQQVQELKELTLRPNIDTNDLNHKIEQAKQFILDGNRCKLVCRFRGREITHSNLGTEKLSAIIAQLDGLIVANPHISLDGKFMSVILVPSKNKTQN